MATRGSLFLLAAHAAPAGLQRGFWLRRRRWRSSKRCRRVRSWLAKVRCPAGRSRSAQRSLSPNERLQLTPRPRADSGSPPPPARLRPRPLMPLRPQANRPRRRPAVAEGGRNKDAKEPGTPRDAKEPKDGKPVAPASAPAPRAEAKAAAPCGRSQQARRRSRR